ncbi:hypothetical protein X733_25635 [Mesorhizobium sp. L2C067A000]|jgi:hypothetical protein|nr:hypothetical protein X767_10880 [Mesorhizobium sp. LSJC264A00]ESZ29644.1 hypothetical protein X733_25635 [Mesorhizobium sp. L2C067A000]
MPPQFHKTLKDGFGKLLDCADSASPGANQMRQLPNAKRPAEAERLVRKIAPIS